MKTTPRSTAFKIRTFRLLAAAAALALPSLTMAQGQIDTSRTNEASNRLGSGGRNSGGLENRYYSSQMINAGNQVNVGNAYVTGNVTQGRAFQGGVPYTDPYAFRGNTAGGISDNFIKNSSEFQGAHTREVAPNQPTLFYGQSSTVQQPPGFVNVPNRGFVPPPAPGAARGVEDQRLGVVDLNQPLSPSVNSGQFMTRGSLNPQQGTGLGVLTGSSLYGVREWNPQDPADRMFLENLLSRNGNAFNRTQIDSREIQRMRDELDKTLNGERPLNSDGTPMRSQDSLNAGPLGQTFESPADPTIVNKPIGQGIVNRPMSGGLGTDQGMRQYVLGNARKTNTQYSEMSKRLEQYYTDRKKTDSDFAREFNEQLRLKTEADAKAKALASNKTNPNEVTPVKPPTDKPAVTPEDPLKRKKPAPVKVPNLSGGVKAEGLASVMKKAEGLMKEGKFASALDQYEAAETVAPNNPMIWLGRANAELGAGFFQRADAHLRQAFMTDKALLLGQYDLTGMLGDERLAKIVAELKDIANKDTKPMPAFLLAYVAYNTGHERQAMGYLDLAEKRADGKDLFFKMIREHWALPDEAPGDAPKVPEKNK